MAFDFSLSDEHKMVQDTFHQLARRLAPQQQALRQRIFKDQAYPEELWQAVAEAGLLGCLIPEQYGGNGLGLLAMTLGMEVLNSYGLGSVLHVITGMDAACILRHGSEAQKQRFLPAIASGALKLCYAHTEPDAGSNLFNTQTHARREGDSYVINGQKVFITAADVCDYMLLVARTATPEQAKAAGKGKTYGLSLFLVDTRAKGIERQQLPMQGLEGCQQFALFFDHVEVPAENLIGPEHEGIAAIFDSLNPERILAAGMALGMTQLMLKRSVDYAKTRKVFGDRPIGSYQAISHPLAEIQVELEATQLLTYRSAWAFDQGLSVAQVGHYANLAKLKGADLAIRSVDQAIETHGGYGFSEEYEIIHFWTAARVMKTAPVTRELILNFVAEHALRLPRS